MGTVLTCWKEIAQYLGKGVRTVQRWEEEMDLPIHRPDAHMGGVVFALPDEINAWIRSHSSRTRSHDSELAALQNKVADLERQNKLLRARLNSDSRWKIAVSESANTLGTAAPNKRNET